jgi:hypothetical protein
MQPRRYGRGCVFASAITRSQLGYYAAEWLDTLDQLVARHEVVVFL